MKLKKIKAINKKLFDESFNNDNIKIFNYGCFISIIDCDNNENRYDTSIDNFLQVKMWDIEEDIYENGKLKYEKPQDSELIKIVDFINKNKDINNFIIHCSAGISRSGAIARYLEDLFIDEIDKQFFNENNKQIQPNLYILKRLKELNNNNNE